MISFENILFFLQCKEFEKDVTPLSRFNRSDQASLVNYSSLIFLQFFLELALMQKEKAIFYLTMETSEGKDV